MRSPSARIAVLAPILAAALLAGAGSGPLAALGADPASARLVQALALAAAIAPWGIAALAARFHQARLALAGVLAGVTGLALLARPGFLEGPGLPALALGMGLAFGLGSRLPEKGATSRGGLRALGLSALLAILPALLCARHADDVAQRLASLGPALQPSPGTGLPLLVVLLLVAAGAACWQAPGRDGDVVGPSLLASLVAAISAPWAASAPAAPVILLGAAGSGLAAVLCVAWRRGFMDDLTQLPGRRALDAELDALTGRYALAVIDVDHFKRFNDEHGHEAGDDALRIVADVLRTFRGGTAHRQGGEEFVAVMPGLSVEEAVEALEELREAIEATPLLVRGRPGGRRRALRVTVSIGVAERSDANPTSRETLRAADMALLRAKKLGRNRVEFERRRARRPRVKEPARSSRIAPARRAADARPAPRRGAARGR